MTRFRTPRIAALAALALAASVLPAVWHEPSGLKVVQIHP